MRKSVGIFVLEGHRVFMFMNLQVNTCLVQSDVILWGPKILPVPVVPANDVSSPFTRTFLSSKLVLSLLWHPERKQDNRNENMNPILRDLSSLSYHEIHLNLPLFPIGRAANSTKTRGRERNCPRTTRQISGGPLSLTKRPKRGREVICRWWFQEGKARQRGPTSRRGEAR
jgi:hypothetical protein